MVVEAGTGFGASEAERLRKDFRAIAVIWTALLAALGVYVAAAHLLADGLKRMDNPDFPLETLKSVLYLVSGVTLVAAGFIRRGFIKSHGRDSLVAPEPEATRSARIAAARYVLATLVSAALAETIGVYGFMLYLLSGEFETLYAFVALSAAAMLFYRPKMEEFENLVLTVKNERANLA